MYPITIRCNVTNPCTEINFINVKVDKWEIGEKITGNICEFATGIGRGNVPNIDCLTDPSSDSMIAEENAELSSEIEIEDPNAEMNMYIDEIKTTTSVKQLYSEMIKLSKLYSD